MFKSEEDLYFKVNQVVNTLIANGDSELAKPLKDSLIISNIKGEIFGEIRLRASELLKNPISQQLQIQNDLRDIVDSLNNIL
jgi:hypothetical protein